MIYDYKVRSREGEIVESRIEAADRDAATEELRRSGNLVINVLESGRKDHVPSRRISLDALREMSLRDLGGHSRSEDLVVFTRQLATMIEAGIPLVRSLRSLAEQTESPRLAGVVDGLRLDVESGASFSEALERRRETFGRLYVEMVRAGEMGGGLDVSLLRVADQLEGDRELRRRVRAAMTYPMFVLVFAVVASVFMLLVIVPIFAGMYADLGGQLPLPTKVALLLSNLLRGPTGLVLLVVGVAGGYIVRMKLRTDEGRDLWGRFALRLPLGIGGVVRKVAIARSARTLGSLISAGVPILSAVDITASSCGNPVIEKALRRSRKAVNDGDEVRVAFEREEVFPPMVIRMVAVGEETGNLDGMLGKVADFYEAEVDAAVKSLTSMIEPAMVLVVGVVVGGTVVAMYLPMFRIFDLIQ